MAARALTCGSLPSQGGLPALLTVPAAPDAGCPQRIDQRRRLPRRCVQPAVLWEGRSIETPIPNSYSDDISSSGLVIGTPIYMGPEQAVARKDFDGRTDVCALGAVL